MPKSAWCLALEEHLRAGGDPNEVVAPDIGWTALHVAAENCDTDAMEVLARYGADLNFPDRRGSTPLHRAVDYDLDGAFQTNADVTFDGTRMLLKLGASIHAKNLAGQTPRDMARGYGQHWALLFDELVAELNVS